MFKVAITDATISKGFEGKPALNFSTNKSAVNFKIGYRVYDKNAPNNHRFINFAVKAFTPLVERIEKMKLKEGSRVHIWGKMDEDIWDDEQGQKQSRLVIIADDIEYASSDTNKSNGNGTNGAGAAPPVQNGNEQVEVPQTGPNSPPAQPQQNSQENQPEGMPSGFGGYNSFDNGENNDFFP